MKEPQARELAAEVIENPHFDLLAIGDGSQYRFTGGGPAYGGYSLSIAHPNTGREFIIRSPLEWLVLRMWGVGK